MLTIAAQNIHQTTPSVLGLAKKYLTKIGRDFRMPIPITLILFRPWQRVSLWQELGANPYWKFLDGVLTMAPHEWDGALKIAADQPLGGMLEGHVPELLANLKTNHATVRLPIPRDRGCVTYAHLSVNVEGAVDLFSVSTNADIVEDVLGWTPMRLSFVQELLAIAVDRPLGVAYHVAYASRLSHRREHLLDLFPAELAEADEDKHLRECPYLTDDGEPLPQEARAPVLGLPLGRWHRELSTILKRGPEAEPGVDPWIESVLRPVWASFRAYQEPSADRFEKARRALLGLPALDWAQCLWEWLEAQEGEA